MQETGKTKRFPVSGLWRMQFCRMTTNRYRFKTAAKVILLHAALVGLDHLLDHLAAHGAGLAAGQVTVVAVLQVHADLLRCVFTSKILSEFTQ